LEVAVFRSLVRAVSLVGSVAVLCSSLGAQEKSTKETKAPIPESAQPPAGMCRIWLNNVPASQQPAATDCASAIRNRPVNGTVVFGNLKDEALQSPNKRAPQSEQVQQPQRNAANWPPRNQTQQPNRVDVNTANQVQTQTRPSDNGVHTVNAMTTMPHPTADTGAKVRRPER
jgi:hypothetical protein